MSTDQQPSQPAEQPQAQAKQVVEALMATLGKSLPASTVERIEQLLSLQIRTLMSVVTLIGVFESSQDDGVDRINDYLDASLEAVRDVTRRMVVLVKHKSELNDELEAPSRPPRGAAAVPAMQQRMPTGRSRSAGRSRYYTDSRDRPRTGASPPNRTPRGGNDGSTPRAYDNPRPYHEQLRRGNQVPPTPAAIRARERAAAAANARRGSRPQNGVQQNGQRHGNQQNAAQMNYDEMEPGSADVSDASGQVHVAGPPSTTQSELVRPVTRGPPPGNRKNRTLSPRAANEYRDARSRDQRPTTNSRPNGYAPKGDADTDHDDNQLRSRSRSSSSGNIPLPAQRRPMDSVPEAKEEVSELSYSRHDNDGTAPGARSPRREKMASPPPPQHTDDDVFAPEADRNGYDDAGADPDAQDNMDLEADLLPVPFSPQQTTEQVEEDTYAARRAREGQAQSGHLSEGAFGEPSHFEPAEDDEDEHQAAGGVPMQNVPTSRLAHSAARVSKPRSPRTQAQPPAPTPATSVQVPLTEANLRLHEMHMDQAEQAAKRAALEAQQRAEEQAREAEMGVGSPVPPPWWGPEDIEREEHEELEPSASDIEHDEEHRPAQHRSIQQRAQAQSRAPVGQKTALPPQQQPSQQQPQRAGATRQSRANATADTPPPLPPNPPTRQSSGGLGTQQSRSASVAVPNNNARGGPGALPQRTGIPRPGFVSGAPQQPQQQPPQQQQLPAARGSVNPNNNNNNSSAGVNNLQRAPSSESLTSSYAQQAAAGSGQTPRQRPSFMSPTASSRKKVSSADAAASQAAAAAAQRGPTTTPRGTNPSGTNAPTPSNAAAAQDPSGPPQQHSRQQSGGRSRAYTSAGPAPAAALQARGDDTSANDPVDARNQQRQTRAEENKQRLEEARTRRIEEQRAREARVAETRAAAAAQKLGQIQDRLGRARGLSRSAEDNVGRRASIDSGDGDPLLSSGAVIMPDDDGRRGRRGPYRNQPPMSAPNGSSAPIAQSMSSPRGADNMSNSGSDAPSDGQTRPPVRHRSRIPSFSVQ